MQIIMYIIGNVYELLTLAALTLGVNNSTDYDYAGDYGVDYAPDFETYYSTNDTYWR